MAQDLLPASIASEQNRDILALLIEQAPVSIAMLDRKMRYVAVSRRWLNDFAGSEAPERWRAAHERALAGERVEDEAEERLRPDGRSRWRRWIAQPWKNVDGNIAGTILFSEDITERKNSERLLRETEDRFHRMFDHMMEGCQLIGFDWRYRYVNQSVAVHSRTARSELIGRTMMEAFPGFERSDLYIAIRDCMENRVPRRLENRFEHADGSFSWFDLSVEPSPEGIFILSIDISERKRAEAQLSVSNERFQQLTERLPQLIWTSDATGHCDFLSRQWENYTGLPAARLCGAGWIETVHAEDRPMLHDAWNTAVRTGANFHGEFRIRRADGKYRWFSANATCQRDAKGLITRWYGANSDVEDEKRVRDLQARNQKMEALGTLAGGIAHDFNNILTAITGNALLALEDVSESHSARQCLHEIERASRRATELVRRILAFSRQEEPHREILELHAVIEEAMQLLRATVPAQIKLHTEYSPGTPRTIADPTQVHQILMNLVTNAAYAIGNRAGRIDIVLEGAMVDEERAAADLRPGQYARVTVADDGEGMDSGTMERIFDPFFTTKPAGEGTGLGLSVVAGIMKTHGGAVTVYSDKGIGTVFRLYFPATTEHQQTAPKENRAVAAAHGQRVLYVDDDHFLISLMKRKLTRLGYAVTCEQDPHAALALFLQDPRQFDAVVTDLSMPGLRGFDLAREMLAARPDLPMVVVSGYIRDEDQQIAQALGIRELVLKPNTSDDLGELLSRLFSRV